MNKFTGRYEKIYEETLYRYQQGGLLRGDYVKIKKDALSNDLLSSLSEQMKAIVQHAIKEGSMFRVSYIKSGHSEAFSGPVDAANIPSCHLWADIYHEHAPGQWSNIMTLPTNVLEKVEVEGANGFAQYDKKLVRPNVVETTPDKEMLDQTKGNDESRKLPKKDTKLAHTKAPKDGRDGLEKPKKKSKIRESYNVSDNDLLAECYTKIYEEVIPGEDHTPSSVVKGFIQKVYDAPTIDNAKSIAIEGIQRSRIPDMVKKHMLFKMSQIDTLIGLQTYLTNSMFQKMGMGNSPRLEV